MAQVLILRPGPLHRGHRTAIPRREALILQAALNHPWLMHDRLEEFAETEFRHADAKRLKAALIDVLAHRFGPTGQESDPERPGSQEHDQAGEATCTWKSTVWNSSPSLAAAALPT